MRLLCFFVQSQPEVTERQLQCINDWLQMPGLGCVILATAAPILGGSREQAIETAAVTRLLRCVLEWQLSVRCTRFYTSFPRCIIDLARKYMKYNAATKPCNGLALLAVYFIGGACDMRTATPGLFARAHAPQWFIVGDTCCVCCFAGVKLVLRAGSGAVDATRVWRWRW